MSKLNCLSSIERNTPCRQFRRFLDASENQRFWQCLCLSLTLLLVTSPLTSTLHANDDTASNTRLNHAGLKIVWFTEAGVGAGRDMIDWTLNVDENRSTTYFVIEANNYHEMITENTLSPFGKPYGLDGAVGYVEVRKEILAAELENQGATNTEIRTEQYTLPKSTIYVLSRDGVLTAIDADSGHRDWSNNFAKHKSPSIGVGASNKYVAAVSGSTTYCFDSTNGKLLWSHACQYGVAAAPAVSDDRIFVPLLNGRMEVFEIEREGYGSYSLVANGIGTARPLVTEKTVSWPTSNGELNVALTTGDRQNSVRFRLLANDAIENSATYKDNLIFATSLDGFVYAIAQDRGSLAWEVSTGAQISQSPVVLGDSVYAITEDHKMYRLDALTGDFRWDAPLNKVGKYVGASRDKIYVTDGLGDLLVIDPESAAILTRVKIGDVDDVLPNRQTDRLFVSSKTGVIQCIHEADSKLPYFHSDEIGVPKSLQASKGSPVPDDNDQAATVGVDEDPFGNLEKQDINESSSDATDDSSSESSDSSEEDDPFGIR